ncbi:HTH_Tnp_Tc3_2 domain-containing protein [Trichonephila clavipes]|nr:HTH_Tnp_Tc3_2 domain-containing protein [Trichonephila clavipes]
MDLTVPYFEEPKLLRKVSEGTRKPPDGADSTSQLPECEARVSSPGFVNDSKMMVVVDVTAQVAPELQRRMRPVIGSYCQKKQTQHSIRPVTLTTGTTILRQSVYIRLGHIGLYARRFVRRVPLNATHCRQRLTWSRACIVDTTTVVLCDVFSPTRPGLVCSLILTGLLYGERQVPVTTKRTPLNDTVTVVQDGSFGEELFLVPELTCMFRV